MHGNQIGSSSAVNGDSPIFAETKGTDRRLVGTVPSAGEAAHGQSWYPPAPPDCQSIELPLVPVLVPLDWNAAVRLPKPALAPAVAWASRPPRAVSIVIRSGRVEHRSFWFGDPPDAPAALPCPAPSNRPTAPHSCTRVRPPGDVI